MVRKCVQKKKKKKKVQLSGTSLWERDVRIHFIKIIYVVRGPRGRLECLVVGPMMLAILNIVLSVCEKSFSFFLFFRKEKLKEKLIRWNVEKNVVTFICVLDYNVCCSLFDVSENPIFRFFYISFFAPLPTLYTPLPLLCVREKEKRKEIQCWGAQRGKGL